MEHVIKLTTVLNVASKIVKLVLLFFLMFGFQIYGINTRYIVLLFLLILLLFKPSNIIEVSRVFKDKRVFYLLLVLTLYVILSIPITILHLKNDFTFFLDSIGVIIVEFISIFYYAFFELKCKKNIGNWIIGVFFLQSLLILLAFVSPNIMELIRKFQYSGSQEIADKYLDAHVIRGLALSGDLFFGLAASFGFAILFSMYKYIRTRNIVFAFCFFFFIAASFFVGRTSLFGALMGIILFIMCPIKNKLKIFLSFVTLLLLFLGLAYLCLPVEHKEMLNDVVFPFALELFYNLNAGDGLSTNSTSALLDMYDTPISIPTFILGDGQFSSNNGSYYMDVDVGYMRQIYFAGISYVLISILILLYLIFPFRFSKFKVRFYNLYNNKIDFFFAICLLLYYLVLHLKGLAIIHGKELMILLTFYFCDLIFSSQSFDEDNRVFYSPISF